MSRGRPPGSPIRQNIIEILAVVGKSYGYAIAKKYLEIFPATTKRNIYYHLKKGVDLGEIEIFDIFHEKGEYSWGTIAEKIYYQIGPKGVARGDERVSRFVNKKLNDHS